MPRAADERALHALNLERLARPRIDGLSLAKQAETLVCWQLSNADQLVDQLSLPLVDPSWWPRRLADKPFSVKLDFVDETTGHGVFMQTHDGSDVTFDMVASLMTLLLEEAKTPPKRACRPLCGFCTKVGSATHCHRRRSTVFRFLNTPDSDLAKADWPWAVFDAVPNVKHCPLGRSCLEIRFTYELEVPTRVRVCA